ncbi:MAG: D-glycero-beta-D-manno-heptose-7-phosphate kinase [Candidatus Brocadiia bacterium]
MNPTTLINRFGSPKIMVLGDLILDKYVWGRVERISPEAPIQILNAQREGLRLGGVANVAHNVVTLGAKSDLVGVVGNDDTGRQIRNLCRQFGINTAGIVLDRVRQTPLKTRMIAQNQQVLRVDNESLAQISAAAEQSILSYIRRNIKHYDIILISDYNKGTLTDSLLKAVIRIARSGQKKVVIDPKGRDYGKYRGATALTPNRLEAELATGIKIKDEASRKQVARKLIKDANLDFVIITLGEKGLYLLDRKGYEVYDPARHLDVYDVTGAGDTVLATLGMAFAGGLGYNEALHLANLAAGVVVSKVGTATVTRPEIIEHYRNLNDTAQGSKLIPLTELLGILKGITASGKKVVFTNGCFDIIHPGHIATLEFAKSRGDILIVGINSDKSVKWIKGPSRPILSQSDRACVLGALAVVDYITIFDEPTPLNLVKQIKPDILIKGMDWQSKGVVGSDVLRKYGGRVVLAPIVKGLSTTDIIKRIKNI